MIEMEETFEALEGTRDLPAQAVQIQNVGRGPRPFRVRGSQSTHNPRLPMSPPTRYGHDDAPFDELDGDLLPRPPGTCGGPQRGAAGAGPGEWGEWAPTIVRRACPSGSAPLPVHSSVLPPMFPSVRHSTQTGRSHAPSGPQSRPTVGLSRHSDHSSVYGQIKMDSLAIVFPQFSH